MSSFISFTHSLEHKLHAASTSPVVVAIISFGSSFVFIFNAIYFLNIFINVQHMITIDRLPIDIIRIVIRHVVDRNAGEKYPGEFKIQLLAVCREWRSVVIPLFYVYAYYGECNAFAPNTHCFTSSTNIDIILKNGYTDILHEFSFLSHRKIYAVDSLLGIAGLLNISVDTCPDIASLMDYHGRDSDIPMDWNNAHHIAAITTIATTFASTFPNIRKLHIDIENSHGIMNCFSSALTACFADQLVDFDYTGSLRFLNKRPLTGLQNAYLALVGDGEEVIYPTIFPQSIQTLRLYIHGLTFNWKLFSTEHNFNKIVFDQLDYLHCLRDVCAEDAGSTNIDFVLRLPSIKKTTIQNFPISTDIIERQLQSGLQELHFINNLSKMLQLSRLNLSSLSKLYLEIPATRSREDIVADTNTLFRQLKGITTIRCNIHLDINNHVLENIYWPHLTQLVIHVGPTIDGVVQAALNMPDLIYLEICFSYFNRRVLASMLEYFDKFRSNHAEPSNSRIEILKVHVRKQAYFEQILSSMQVLKWFWPKLTTIVLCK